MRCISLVILLLLVVAVAMDFFFDKIYNEWILISLTIGLAYAVWSAGAGGLIRAIISMTIPFMILYPLFMIGGLGAGDIKLLAVMGCFFTWKELMICLLGSFLIGAVFSLLKMVAEKNFLQRLTYLLSYLHDIFKNRAWKLYELEIQEKKEKNRGKIHFSLPILLSVMLLV